MPYHRKDPKSRDAKKHKYKKLLETIFNHTPKGYKGQQDLISTEII